MTSLTKAYMHQKVIHILQMIQQWNETNRSELHVACQQVIIFSSCRNILAFEIEEMMV